MLRYAIDELNVSRIRGWAFDPESRLEVVVVVQGKPVGRARTGEYRADVAHGLGDERASHCGFEFQFRKKDFRHTSGETAEVVLQLGDVRTPAVPVPLLARRRARRIPRGPFPPEILSLLASYRSRYETDAWDEALMEEAAADLSLLLQRGPRVPALHAYLIFLGQLWLRAMSVRRYFPRANEHVGADAKDRSAVQSNAREIYCMAAHLATLKAHEVPGPVLEFGCFKGFSTSILSDACHQLGLAMHVFDSFAGLPPSKSAFYREGDFAGSREEVEANVAAYGRASAVTFHEGFFSETVARFDEPRACCIWIDVDLTSSSRDAMTVLPRLDPRGVVFSHEAPPEIFTASGVELSDYGPEAVVPPIIEAFAAAGRPLAARHLDGHTGAFWHADAGIPPLTSGALVVLRKLAFAL
jgi:hypothetical protein